MQSNAAKIITPSFPSVLLSLDSLSSISFHWQFLLIQRSSAGIGTSSFSLSWLALLSFILHSISLFPRSSTWDGSYTIPTSASWSGLSLLYLIQRSIPTLPLFVAPPLGKNYSIPIGVAVSGLRSSRPRLALLYFILHTWSSSLFSVPPLVRMLLNHHQRFTPTASTRSR